MEEQKERMIVNGFLFSNIAEMRQAEKEAEGIRIIKEKLDMKQPEKVLQVYNKLVRERLFETAAGLSYLKELQEYLQMAPSVDKAEILPIPVRHTFLERQMRARYENPKTRKTVRERYVNVDYKNRYRIMSGVAAILFVCVAVMFVISATAGSPTIVNYEQKLINRYAGWEEELEERESVIRQKEAELGIGDE